jgi:hypothetical protein
MSLFAMAKAEQALEQYQSSAMARGAVQAATTMHKSHLSA